MHNASFHSGTGASAIKGPFVSHNRHVNFAFIDGHIEHLKKERVIEILSGRDNLDKVYFDPFYAR